MVNAAVDKRRAAQPARGRPGGPANLTISTRAIVPVANGERWWRSSTDVIVVAVVWDRGELNPAVRRERARRCTAQEAAKRRRHREE